MNQQIKSLLLDAGNIAADRYHQGVDSAEKERFHLVTDADRDIEKLIINRLQSLYPADGFVGEEGGELRGTSGKRWLIDPIDGTTDFIMGKPYFAISLAKEEQGEITEGYVYNPVSNELYFSTKESGESFLNGKRISASKTSDFQNALVVFGFSARMDRIQRYYNEWQWLFEGCRKGVGWTTPALTICNVARGRIDVFIDCYASTVGHAAAGLILKNAGGVIRNYEGDGYDHRVEGIVGCAVGLAEEILKS